MASIARAIVISTSMTLAYLVLVMVIANPILLLSFAIFKRREWQDESFDSKCGEFLYGARLDKPEL